MGWDYRVILRRLTSERLSPYITAGDDDLVRAFQLYEWNMRASSGVLTLCGMVEVIVRNALDEQLRAWARRRHPGKPWFDCAPLDRRGHADVAKARKRATRGGRDPELHGKVIAELSLGFWRYVAASRYLTTLWIPAAFAAFPNLELDPQRARPEVERRLQHLTFVRNRAAHHEPIHRRNLLQDHDDAVELIRWICTDSASWVEARSPIPALMGERP